MTTSDDAQRPAGPAAGSAGEQFQPTIRGRLRNRLPGRIRTARGQLIVLAGYLLLTVIIITVVSLLGGFKNSPLRPEQIAAYAIVPAILAGLCIVAGRFLIRRSWLGYWLAIAAAFLAMAGGIFAIARVISGVQGLAGDPGFFFVVYQGVHVVLGAAILVNLLGYIRSYGEIAAEADRTGKDLQVELRDIRVKSGTAAAAAIEAGEIADAGIAAGAGGSRVAAVAMSPIAAPPASPRVEAEPPGALARARGEEPLLAVRGLKKHFPIVGGTLRRQIGTVYAVDGVDFDVYRGEIFSLVGESGCGKTTLGRSVLQLTPPTDGHVIFDGYELADVDPDDMRPLRRRMQIIF
ncbi:MAG: ATP-binding cassette domain-containing protein, partial [Chloroflexota bacterium]